MAIVNIDMRTPKGSRILPSKPAPATTAVRAGDQVSWTSADPAAVTLVAEFDERDSPFVGGTFQVALGESPVIKKEAEGGLFPYHILQNGRRFRNGGALIVEPT